MSIERILMGAVKGSQTFVDDVFASHTYTGNGSTQTITNGIDLAGKGGLVWIKRRSDAFDHALFDTSRGINTWLSSDLTNANSSNSNSLTSFNANGFSIGSDSSGNINGVDSSKTFVSWSFRKAAKFFDIVTWTGDGTDKTVNHSLGVAPGMIIVKRTDSADDWYVYHRSLTTPNENWLKLNSTAAANGAVGQDLWGNPSDTSFKADTYLGLSTNGATYVAYLFAHDTSTDGIIQCGSYVGNGGTNQNINLGWEAQFLLVRSSSNVDNWAILDSARGWTSGGNDARLVPNTANAESSSDFGSPTATGFETGASTNINASGQTYIYLAIRRSNKPPTTGTQVYNAIAYSGNGASSRLFPSDFVPDFGYVKIRSGYTYSNNVFDRLRGSPSLSFDSTAAEAIYGEIGLTKAYASTIASAYPIAATNSPISNGASGTYILNLFKRAVGVFDIVCYTGTGSATTVAHGLGVAPEMIIVKRRDSISDWQVGYASASYNQRVRLNLSDAQDAYAAFSSVGASTFIFNGDTNGATRVAYLFATKAGISKVGSYTGNGSSQTIDCGFSTGARFVLIKRTDSTGDWYVWDTVRGIVAGNDPHLSLNTTAAEVTTDDSIDPANAGFIVNQLAATNINVNAATYIYLAFA